MSTIVPCSLRLDKGMKDHLDAAARRNGRTFTMEVKLRLQASLHQEDPTVYPQPGHPDWDYIGKAAK